MVKGLVAAACFVGCSLVQASAAEDGPFGVTMGSDPKSYGCTVSSQDKNWYDCKSLPRMHPDFEFYMMQAYPSTGVCFIKAVGKNVKTNGYGLALRGKVDEVAEQLKQSYGDNQLTDYLVSGSIWDETDDWMMGLEAKDRSYFYIWEESSGSKLKNHLRMVGVGANALSKGEGYPTVEFYFDNDNECEAAKKNEGAGAF